MECSLEGNSLYVEVSENIRSADLFIRGDDQPKQVVVKSKSITTKHINGQELSFDLPVTVDPKSFYNVQQHVREGVSFKLCMPTSSTNTHRMSSSIKRYGSEIYYLKRGPSQCACQLCDLSFFNPDVTFSRVLPLPSQSWTELINNWSCCSKDDDECTSGKKNTFHPTTKKLQPREGDCYIGDIFIAVHSKAVRKNNVYFKKKINKGTGWDMKCKRCKALIGDCDQPGDEKCAYRFLKSCVEIVTTHPSTKTNSSETTYVRPIFYSEFFLERILAEQFSTAVDTHVTQMLVIQDPSKNVHLLVRVLNNSTSLFTTSASSYPDIENLSSNHTSKLPKTKQAKDKPSTSTASASGDASVSKASPQNRSKIVAVAPDQTRNLYSYNVGRLFSFSNHYINIPREFCETLSEGKERRKIVKVLYACTGRDKTNK